MLKGDFSAGPLNPSLHDRGFCTLIFVVPGHSPRLQSGHQQLIRRIKVSVFSFSPCRALQILWMHCAFSTCRTARTEGIEIKYMFHEVEQYMNTKLWKCPFPGIDKKNAKF
jgi:hypothetical protein